MKLLVLLVALILPAAAHAQTTDGTPEQWRLSTLSGSFERMVASHYTDDSGNRLTNDDFDRQSMGSIRHSRKQISSGRTSEVRLTKDGQSFIIIREQIPGVSDSMADHAAIEFADLIPWLTDEIFKKEILESKNTNRKSSGKKRALKNMNGSIVFRVSVNTMEPDSFDPKGWSTIALEWAFVGDEENHKDFLR